MITLDLQQVALQFTGMDKKILNNINYQVNASDFVIILGSNGSGKSSLLKLLDKRYKCTSGSILLDGKSMNSFSSKDFSRNVKTLTQNCHESLFTSLTIFENYLLIKQQYEPNIFAINQQRDQKFLADYLTPFNPNLASKLDQLVEQLSGGEAQALALALTMLYPPKILLLDEHTSALDPKSAAVIMVLTQKIVEQYKITCLLTTHDLMLAEQFGNRILALQNGSIYRKIEKEEKLKLKQPQLMAACY